MLRLASLLGLIYPLYGGAVWEFFGFIKLGNLEEEEEEEEEELELALKLQKSPLFVHIAIKSPPYIIS
jgi:hypothetical protein